jgi:hypothetical protein
VSFVSVLECLPGSQNLFEEIDGAGIFGLAQPEHRLASDFWQAVVAGELDEQRHTFGAR